jgi:hypothetical protein
MAGKFLEEIFGPKTFEKDNHKIGEDCAGQL